MINNNKGAILLVTVVSMMILTIIGYITLQMVTSQGVTDTYEQARIRTEYAAEGIVERAKGYIKYIVEQNMLSEGEAVGGVFGDFGYYPNASGFLFSKVREESEHNEHGWKIFEGVVDPINHHYGFNGSFDLDHIAFEDSIYPVIHARVWCEFVKNKIKGADKGNDLNIHMFSSTGDKKQTYKLVGVAYTTVNAADVGVIVSTVTYYFNTERKPDDSIDGKTKYTNDRTTIIWRKEKES